MSDVKKLNRIWELDFFRGVCIWGVVFIHFIVDLTLFTNLQFETPLVFDIIREYGSVLFILLSGICVTLGHRSTKRGLIVFACGILISVVTYLLFQNTTDMVWFGILHLLGTCMLLYPLFRKMPSWILPVISLVSIVLGYWFETLTVQVKWLFPLGLIYSGFGSGDYFPIFPHLGFFVLGIFLGRLLYKNRTSLLPSVKTENPVIRFFCFCGRHSLWIYLGHQPIAYAIVMLLFA